LGSYFIKPILGKRTYRKYYTEKKGKKLHKHIVKE
jgi:hypothetical protein